VTRRTWVGDVGDAGPDAREEINLVDRGGNYQWSFGEGTRNVHARPDRVIGVEKGPVHEYPHEKGNNCVIGGHVYRGREHPDLAGKYVFGDNGSGRIWVMSYQEGKPAVVNELCSVPASFRGYRGLASFGVDNHGELLLCLL